MQYIRDRWTLDLDGELLWVIERGQEKFRHLCSNPLPTLRF